jgi:hypothetical protein
VEETIAVAGDQKAAHRQQQDIEAEEGQGWTIRDGEREHGLEGRDDQSHHQHLHQFLLQLIETADFKQSASSLVILPCRLDRGDQQLVGAVAEDQQGDADQIEIDPGDHPSQQLSDHLLGGHAGHHHQERLADLERAQHEGDERAHQAHDHRQDGDQSQPAQPALDPQFDPLAPVPAGLSHHFIRGRRIGSAPRYSPTASDPPIRSRRPR